MNTHSMLSLANSSPRAINALAASLTLVVAQVAWGQAQIQPQRIGGTPTSARTGVSGGVNRVSAGRGNALGDGTGMGGQTFSWTRAGGSGQQLGGGNVLDRNSQVGSGGANAPGANVDYNARNLLITNSVPGGRGFRAAVGYTADTDFRAATGSDSTYNFRAGSALSNPVFLTSAAYQDRFLVAQGLGVFEYRRDSTPIGIAAQRQSDNQPDSRLRLDRANAQMAFGRMNWDMGEDRTVATGKTTNGDAVRYIVSPLRGLQAEAMTDPIVASGLGIYEQARARQDINRGLMTLDDLSTANVGATRIDRQVRSTAQGETLRIKDTKVVPKTYLDLLAEIEAKAAAKAADSKGDFKSGLDRVKSDLDKTSQGFGQGIGQGLGQGLDQGFGSDGAPGSTTDKPTKPSTEPQPATVPGSSTDGNPLIPGNAVLPDGGEAEREADRVKARGKLLPIPDMADILRHGRTIDQLGTTERRRVDELVREGEDALKKGEYFQAERRFTQAQSIASDNPLVEVGIAHAQLGAGLYLSAGLTLRSLFTENPELIDAKYDTELLPSGERLAQATQLMRSRIERGDDIAGYGLVLAYIGHQTGERALVEEGLKAMDGNESLATARELLKGVWLGKSEATPAPAQPATPPTGAGTAEPTGK